MGEQEWPFSPEDESERKTTPNIVHDLRVFAAQQEGDDLVIDLYGGPENACGGVRFTFTSAEQLKTKLELVQSWCDDQLAVALVTDESQIQLIDERRLAEGKEAA